MIMFPHRFGDLGINLLLLPIYMFEEFELYNDHISLVPKVECHPELLRYLLLLLHMTTGYRFHSDISKDCKKIDLYCSDNPDYFRELGFGEVTGSRMQPFEKVD